MKNNFSFSRLFENKRFVQIFSIVAGIIVWLVVTITVSPDGTKVVQNVPISIDLTNTVPAEYGLSVIEVSEQTISVDIEGKRYKLGNLDADDFIATPVLNSVSKPGTYELPITVVKADPKEIEYDVAKDYSATVKVKFDTLEDRTFNLDAIAENIHASDGFIREEPYVSPETIILTGPASELDKIARCVVQTTDEHTSDQTITVEGTLRFYDENNNTFTPRNTTYEDSLFEITVPINKHKTVPLVVRFINAPSGLDVSQINYTLSSEYIEISGQKTRIDEYSEIKLDPIDLRSADIGSVFTLDVDLIAGITNVNNINTVTVTIGSENMASRQFNIPSSNILTQNEPASYNIEVMTKTINNVKIVGRSEDIEMLASNDLIAVIDFDNFDVTDGSSRVPVTLIYATGNKFVWAVDEYRVLINAEKN